jgi:FixJ family two-component response regulator
MGHATGFVVAIVDDDHRVLESLQDLLEAAGHTARLFSSAVMLLETGLSGIDCLISDIGMPVVDGFELQRHATRVRPGLPVILITGRHEIQVADRAAASGYQSFFRKPFDGQDLLTAVNDALRAAQPED